MSELKKHPDYSEGFFDAQEGVPAPLIASEAYTAGREAFGRVERLMADNGFTRKGDGFAKTLIGHANSEEGVRD
jgi:hypothetical protein